MNNSFVNIGGEELEIRTITARQYLSARLEAELMGEVFGEDQLGKSVLFGASLLSKGLFFDGQRVFSSMENVLDAMSADDIVTVAGFIDIDPEMKAKIVEDVERIKTINRDVELYKDRIVEITEESDQLVEHHVNEGGEELPVYENAESISNGFYLKAGNSLRSNMRRVSDFFQRDSRRYDGTISSY